MVLKMSNEEIITVLEEKARAARLAGDSAFDCNMNAMSHYQDGVEAGLNLAISIIRGV